MQKDTITIDQNTIEIQDTVHIYDNTPIDGSIGFFICKMEPGMPLNQPCTIELAYRQANDEIANLREQRTGDHWFAAIVLVVAFIVGFAIGIRRRG